MRSGYLWLLLYAVAVVPLALFGASIASEYVYLYRHAQKPHLSDSSYDVLKNEWEAVGALAGGAPGLLLVGRSQIKRRREDEREVAFARQAAGDVDRTVWPPPPDE